MRILECVLLAGIFCGSLPAWGQTRVEGRVLDHEGVPIAGARIDAFERESPEATSRRHAEGRGRIALTTVTSGADGSFRIAPARPFSGVQATAAGYAPAFAEVEDDLPLVVTLNRAALKNGLITAGGKPVPGARVIWVSGDGGEVSAMTGDNGAFSAPDPAVASAELIVVHPDFAPLRTYASGRDGTRPLDQKLEAGVVLRGSVVDDATRKPVAGADVWVDDAWPLSRTGESGTFTIAHAPADWTTLTARVRQSIGHARRKGEPLVIALKPAHSLSGAIVDALTRKPMEGALVGVNSNAGTQFTTYTNTRGEYTLTGLPAGRYQPYVVRSGYVSGPDPSRTIDLRTAATERFDWALARKPRLEGRVVDEVQRPVEGALVGLGYKDTPHIYAQAWLSQGGNITRTAADGSFKLTLPASEEAGDGMSALLKDRPLIVLKQGFAAARVRVPPPSPKPAPILVTMSPGIELRGRITDAQGTPIAGAAVAVAEDGSVGGSLMPTYAMLAQALEDSGWTRSDASGEFVVRVHDTLHHVAVRKSGFPLSLTRRYDPRQGPPLEVVLEPAVALRGRVRRPDGRGVAGVETSAAPPVQVPGVTAASAVTSETGDFEITGLSRGFYRFSAHHYELGISESRTVEAPAGDLEIVLPATASLQGRVLEAGTQKPVNRYTISAFTEGRSARIAESADAEGAFAVTDIPAGNVTLTFTAEGYVTTTVSGLILEAGVESPAVEVLMDPDVPIRGRVTDGVNAPIAEVRVSVEKAAAMEGALSVSAEGDDNGEFELRGLSAGEVTLGFVAPGYAKLLRTINTRTTAQVNVTLTKGLALKGEVVGAFGAGIADAHVSASSSAHGATDQSAQTGDDGRFTIEGLVPGRYTVSASASGKGSAKLEDIDVETAREVRLVLEREKTTVLTGKVVGLPEGEDADMSIVIAHNEETGSTAEATLDASRSFRMEDAPAGRVQVRAMTASLTTGAMRASRTVELSLTPGVEAATIIEFSNDITINGTVTRNGGPVPYALVAFSSGAHETTSRTDERGAYQAEGLEPGRYQVRVMADTVSFMTRYLVSGSATLDIDMTGGSIAGRVVQGADGSPLSSVEVSFFHIGVDERTPAASTTTNGQGAFLQRALPEGRYRLITAKAGFGQEVLEVEVTRGGTAEALLELTPAEGLNVTVVDGRDQRPLDATIVVRDESRRIVANRHAGIGADGALHIPLSSGAYSLSTSAAGYGTATVKVTAPGKGLRIGLTPGGTLVIESTRDLRGRVRLIQPDGDEYIRCWCNGIAEIELKGKRTVVENITPGSYKVELLDEAGSTPQPVVVIEGQRSTVILQ